MNLPPPSFDAQSMFPMPKGLRAVRRAPDPTAASRKLLGADRGLPLGKRPAGGLSLLAIRAGR